MANRSAVCVEVCLSTLCFDYDPLLYSAGSVGEKRSIKVIHRQSGDEYEFDTRTAFWGHWKKKAGGWLAEYNAPKSEGKRRKPEEFDIIDVQEPEPIAQCIHTLKRLIAGVYEVSGAKRYYGYSGKGTVFREDISTILKYKGNRDSALRPVHLDELKDYLVKHQACKIITGIEADDACSIDSYLAYQKWKKSKSDDDKLILAYVDKDYLQCAAHLLHADKLDGIDSYEGFGKLFLNEKGEVKGRGRMWLYQQVLDGDDSDNYFANSASTMKWASKSAYDLLKDCNTDQEAFTALVAGYKTLYPQPKKIVGWRGYTDFKNKVLADDWQKHEIEVDWLYMLQENFNLAKMLRTREEKPTNVKEVLDKLKVEY